MKTELYWLTVTALTTALMWIPYILNSFFVRGIFGTMENPSKEWKPLSDWAVRAKAAHYNAIENLVVMGVLVLVSTSLSTQVAGVEALVKIYFFARLAHFAVYTFGIPYLRTVLFLVGFAMQVMVAINLLGV